MVGFLRNALKVTDPSLTQCVCVTLIITNSFVLQGPAAEGQPV